MAVRVEYTLYITILYGVQYYVNYYFLRNKTLMSDNHYTHGRRRRRYPAAGKHDPIPAITIYT